MHDADGQGRRLRVVTLVDGIGLAGGAERLAREVVLRLDPDRFEPTLCVSRWSEERARAAAEAGALAGLERAGVGFLPLRRRGTYDLLSWRPLWRLLRDGIDVLHGHKIGSNVWAAVLGTLARTPAIVAHEHTWSFEGQPLRKLLDRRLIAPRADAFLAVSELDRRRMIEVERIDPAKVIFVPNGIPEPPPRGDVDVRRELGIGREAPIVGTVCALRPQKALDVLIDAAAILARRIDGLRVLIVGEGPERPALERRIAELGLAATVVMLGHRDDVRDLIGEFDVAACSSDFEGTPLSVLEYMQAALPIVATRVGGIPDIVADGSEGMLVEPRDPAALAAAVARLLGDRDLAARLGSGARERQLAEFDIGVTVRAVERIYEGLASGLTAAELGAGR
ncbi:MAG: glycosyltransferase family 1 protein [Acidobacteria bacterium]|nr:MAG: glycosyltransferase family 1 protein [Acidobacteriota bacterium]GIK78199.1 MAG: glycosyl transferase family 1 [Actinomycetes bacterium]